jgi:hypothetical protein
MNAAVPRILCAHLIPEFNFVSGRNDVIKARQIFNVLFHII